MHSAVTAPLLTAEMLPSFLSSSTQKYHRCHKEHSSGVADGVPDSFCFLLNRTYSFQISSHSFFSRGRKRRKYNQVTEPFSCCELLDVVLDWSEGKLSIQHGLWEKSVGNKHSKVTGVCSTNQHCKGTRNKLMANPLWAHCSFTTCTAKTCQGNLKPFLKCTAVWWMQKCSRPCLYVVLGAVHVALKKSFTTASSMAFLRNPASLFLGRK